VYFNRGRHVKCIVDVVAFLNGRPSVASDPHPMVFEFGRTGVRVLRELLFVLLYDSVVARLFGCVGSVSERTSQRVA